MRFTYTFSPVISSYDQNITDPVNNQDTIMSAQLSRDNFMNFIQDVQNINQDRQYSVYVYGEYLDFLKKQIPYSYIKFIITSEHVMDLTSMSLFMISFHELCQQYSIGYDLIYGANLADSDINQNPKSQLTFNINTIQAIRLYSALTADGVSLIDNKNLQTIGQITLYSTIMSMKKENLGLITLIKTRKRFQTPIKIT